MASTKYKVESGIQLLARLTKKKGIDGFYPIIFEDGPKLEDFIEIYSKENATCLLADLICESLIPKELDGPESSIIILNTDGKLTINYIMNLARRKLLEKIKFNTHKSFKEDLYNLDFLLNSMLKNLFILEIFETTQFYITIQNMEIILVKNPNISMIIFDTLTAFYWDEQNLKVTKMDLYIKKILCIIHKVIKDFKVTVMYTRPEYFSSSKESIENLEPCCQKSVVEQINYRIQIVYNDNGVNHINVRTYNKQFQRKFNIINDKIKWL